ncbi:endonuclease/exonuclease/phosphatase family protein [Haloferula chungangensis]|uniref:Endonuclease/exonuclease/phosphatase family protein n=1 Tax=Haloferula chungangensis TaxID=1048331 RepID=A0ABW2L9G2_9BACT
MWRLLVLLFCLSATIEAVGLRVVSFNIGAHFTSGGYPDYSLGGVETIDFTSVRDVLGRIDADVVALQEVHSSDVSGNPDDLDALAALLGLPHIYMASTSGSFDTSLRVVFLSRYPFISTDDVRSPSGAKEITRHFPVVKVDVPGTSNDPLLISGHLKAGTGLDDRFRRAVEMKRLAKYLDDQGLQASDNFIILGDFNPSSVDRTFTAPPSGLPSTYVLGDDFSFPISYSTNLLSYFSGVVPTQLDPRQLNGDDGTFQYGQRLDLILVSPALAGRPHASEIYRSTLDTSNTSGLVKTGQALANNASLEASDHYAVFADFELDQDFSELGLAISAPSVVEGDDSGTVRLTVSLPMPQGYEIHVQFATDDPAVAPLQGVLTIPPGQSSATTSVQTTRNYLVDGNRRVTFTAMAPGYDPASVMLDVIDADGAYVFEAVEETIVERFDGFNGAHSPAPWISNASAWIGPDDGSFEAVGGRSYGMGGEHALGFLAGSQALESRAVFKNESGETLSILDIAYTAEQWRAVTGGRADQLRVELESGGVINELSPLGFVARTDLASGPSNHSERKSLRISGLSIPNADEFTLTFTLVPGAAAGVPPDEVFINEFHYDNESSDTGEFVEIVVGPGYHGELTDILLVFYNGSSGKEGSRHGLESFTPGEITSSGHRIFSKWIPGIQNGGDDPDGMALVVGESVESFLSYEGSFLAIDGPANGRTSIDVGVSQGTSEPVGMNALGLIGAGGSPGDFVWEKIPGPHSPGVVNAGQMLEVPTLLPQGLAIDDLMVSFIADSDGDGIGDDEDPDDDNDGQSDEFELAFGSDPLNAGSVFKARLSAIQEGYQLSFPGAEGVLYQVQISHDLKIWAPLSSHLGEGADLHVALPSDGEGSFFRVKVDE